MALKTDGEERIPARSRITASRVRCDGGQILKETASISAPSPALAGFCRFAVSRHLWPAMCLIERKAIYRLETNVGY
ncbi:hypothetical protein OPV22_033530 [Ensete ventricosum]|uniref:Uncharacterized protein n=1 Tax=Ensete ventricosum TaxID=4639 RepID=A0AAV8Q2A4_ENSVE|nr:hypothetical protein OPV22_033530 [Ensete ventricosum]